MTWRARIRCAVQRLAGGLVPWRGVVSLNYHRIGDGRRSIYDRGLFSATAEGFDAQLRWIARHFDVVTPADLAHPARLARGRHVLVTFDDGYADNHDVAFPILRAHRLPATFFVATGFLDRPVLPWWDEIAWMIRTGTARRVALPGGAAVECDEPEREGAVRTVLRAYKRLPVAETAAFLDAVGEATGSGRHPRLGAHPWMTWDMVRGLSAGGMTVGGHTVSHQVLSRMPRDEQAREISGCLERLEAELGVRPRTFSYPVGTPDAFGVETRTCLRDAGVETAFSYYGGFRRLAAWDPYDVPRFAVEQDTTDAELRALLAAPWL